MSIQEVDFGRLDAEADRNLQTYFVDTGVLGRLSTGEKQFVIGRKGSGKTALFKAADQGRLSRDVIAVEFLDYPWQSHKLVRDEGGLAESAYVASWRFTFLVHVCRNWSSNGRGELAARSKKFLKDIFGDVEPGPFEVLFDSFKRIRKLNFPTIAGQGGGGIEIAAPSGALLAQSISRWSRVLEGFVDENYPFFPFTLKLDRLDEGWDASPESRAVMAGVLKAARDLNLRLGQPKKPPPVLTFLRSDIFNELQFNDKNKMSADVEYLDWSNERLIEVPALRISRSLVCPVNEAWDLVFSKDPMRQRASVRSYILKRTMGRPRDIIAYCIKCKEAAMKNGGHDRAETSDVYDAEEGYSRHIYDELDDEMHKQVPNGRECLQALRDIGRTKFRLDEWLSLPRVKRLAQSEDAARGYLKVLFDYSVVGVPRLGGAGGGSSIQFNYHDRLLEPNFEQEITVHPSLKKHLVLADARRDSDSEE